MFACFQKKGTGHELMEKIHCQLDVIEKDYFGLQYTDSNNISHWLDPTKLVKKQVKSRSILNFLFLEICVQKFNILILALCLPLGTGSHMTAQYTFPSAYL